MLVALFQAAFVSSDVERNLQLMRSQIKRAGRAGASLIVFPELCTTGCFLPDRFSDWRKLAEPKDGRIFRQLALAAAQENVAVIYGYPELLRVDGAGSIYCNSLQFISNEGTSIANYRKTHLSEREAELFTQGDEIVMADYGGIKIGLLIGCDIMFPEIVRSLALDGARLVVVPAAAGKDHLLTPKVVVPSRAMENQIFVAYANHCGQGCSQGKFAGFSGVAGPDGSYLQVAGEEESLVLGTVDLHKCEEVKNLHEYFVGRRLDLYTPSTLKARECSSKRVEVAAYQGTSVPCGVDENLQVMTEQMRRAAMAGASLIIFPELFTTGYCLPNDAEDWKRLAETRYGYSFQKLKETAKKEGIAVLYGYSEEAKDISGQPVYYNSAQFIDKNGCSLANYRKSHLWVVDEPKLFTPGDEIAIVEHEGLKIGLLICYDVEFPEIVRRLALEGVHFVAVPTAEILWSSLLPYTRAIENRVFVSYVNHCGTESGCRLTGRSVIVSPFGEAIVSAGPREECLLLASIDPTCCQTALREMPCLSQRRPEMYAKVY